MAEFVCSKCQHEWHREQIREQLPDTCPICGVGQVVYRGAWSRIVGKLPSQLVPFPYSPSNPPFDFRFANYIKACMGIMAMYFLFQGVGLLTTLVYPDTPNLPRSEYDAFAQTYWTLLLGVGFVGGVLVSPVWHLLQRLKWCERIHCELFTRSSPSCGRRIIVGIVACLWFRPRYLGPDLAFRSFGFRLGIGAWSGFVLGSLSYYYCFWLFTKPGARLYYFGKR